VLEMYDIFLKHVRQEILSVNILELNPLKFNEYKAYVKNSLKELVNVDKQSLVFFNQLVKNIAKDVDLLVKTRFVKAILGSRLQGESVDQDFIKTVGNLIDYVKQYLSGFTIEYEGRVVSVFLRDCRVGDRLFRKGDITLLDPRTSLKLYMDQCIKILYQPYVASILGDHSSVNENNR